jgi:hypothetical protein
MKHKIIFASMLLALLNISFVFALSTINPTSLQLSEPKTSLIFTLTPDASCTSSSPCNYIITPPNTLTHDNGVPITLTHTGNTNNIYQAQPITISSNVDYTQLSIGKSYSGTIKIERIDTANNNEVKETLTLPVSFTSSFCSAGEQGTALEITDVRLDNSDGDDDEWSPLDEIEVRVEVSNEGSEKVKDVFVELGLFNAEGKNVIRDMEDLDDEEIDLGNIGDGDEDTATFKFTVPADFDSGNFRLVVKAYSDDLKETALCTAHASDLSNNLYQTISGEREEDEDKHVIFHNIKVSPSPAQCGDRVQLTGEVANIGDEDYEDQVKVTLSNKELNLNIEEIVREDLEQGNSELVDFEFDVPQLAAEKSYVLEFKTYYDYDDRDDSYDLSSEETFTTSIRVEGNCKKPEVKNVAVSAVLDPETPEAVAGKQVVINANVRNTGDSETTYGVSLTGYESWATVVSVEPTTVTLAPGQTKTVTVILQVNPDTQGDKEFTIRTAFDGATKEQKVSLVVGSETVSPGESQLTPVIEHIRANWFIYLIIVVNIILIIAIILVIRSMVSTPSQL